MGEKNRVWRLLDVIRWTSDYFLKKGIDNHQLEAEWLIGHFLKLSRIQLYLQFDRPLTKEELSPIREGIKERVDGKPLQLIIGSAEFMGIKLKVREGVLIPRQETEILVEYALGKLKSIDKPMVLDVGCGSGNISCSLAYHIPEAKVNAIDISPEAISLTGDNADMLGLRDRIIVKQTDWQHVDGENDFDAVLSNPPYVRSGEYASLSPSIREYEPEQALLSGNDGLNFIRSLIPGAFKILKKRGFLAFEIGINQEEECLRMMRKNGFRNLQTIPDYDDNPRVIAGEKA